MTVTVFVSDPTAEAERVSEALRAAGFQVIDVPLSMLVARVAVQRPHVVIVDADAEGALEAIARLREIPECESIDLLFTGRAASLPSSMESAAAAKEGVPSNAMTAALAFEGSGFFARPLDPDAIVKKVSALSLGGGRSSAPPKKSSRPPSEAPSSEAPSSRGGMSRKNLSQPPPRLLPGASASMRTAPLSQQLEKLLEEAEGRVHDAQHSMSEPPFATPEEEIRAVLPEEILAALDAPLEEEDEEDVLLESAPRGTTSGGREPTTGARRQEQTNDGAVGSPQTQGEPTGSERSSRGGSPPTTEQQRSSSMVLTPNQVSPRASSSDDRAITAFGVVEPPQAEGRTRSEPPPRRASVPPASMARPPPSVLSSTLGSDLLVQRGAMLMPSGASAFGEPSPSPPAVRNEPSVVSPPIVLGPTEPARVLGRAIADRATGTLTFESESGVRRIVLREGDLVTAASGIDGESLLAFLGARGDLPKERVAQLAGRLPPNGRHAGAALVAQGALGQDQMWTVLRAHAEFLIGRCFSITSGAAQMEVEAPGRLRNEPSVFGGSTGAEVFVDTVRRWIDTDNALRALGSSSRVGDGASGALFGECALGQTETALLSRSRGESVGSLVGANPGVDVAPLLYALALLGVIDVVRAVAPRQPSVDMPTHDPDALDDDAVRDRVRARLDLVDEGDYFALLGVPRTATSYDVRRAYLDLRQAFDPARLLTPRLADLSDDVRKISSVLEEAYEILHDGARRERYRRAIEDVPGPRPS